jgi:hypothetical protein
MSEHFAYEGGVPGSREPTMGEHILLAKLVAAQLQVFGIEHLLRIHQSIVEVATSVEKADGELHADCYDRDEASGYVGFVYIGTEHMDTMSLRPDTQEHIRKLHERHAEAKRAHEAQRPRAN